MKLFMRFIGALVGLSMLSACNTVDGMGKDFRRAGEAISETAQQTKKKMSN